MPVKFVPVYSNESEESLTNEFKDYLQDKTYLDHAGATLYAPQQIKNVQEALSRSIFSNPHSKSSSSKITEDLVDAVRDEILEFFGTTSTEYSVIFTSGATAALKLVAETFNYNNGEFVYLQENHTSVLGMRAYANKHRSLTNKEAFELFSIKNCRTNERKGTKTLENGSMDDPQSRNANNCLFVYPAQCNFSGFKYPLEWVQKTQNGCLKNVKLEEEYEESQDTDNWYCLLDAASYVATSPLNLSDVSPDFVCLSFYKIFGYPTGLGALLVRSQSGAVLTKQYFGGGTVFMALACCDEVAHRTNLQEKFEDGTIPFLSIISLKYGFECLKRHKLTMALISKHVFSLANYVYTSLCSFRHFNNTPLCILYHDDSFQSHKEQGGIVNFNVLRADGSFIGFAQVMHMANLYNISIRTGCFCNPGACQRHLNISPEEVKSNFELGHHVCGDQHDIINNKPTGSVRISFGYMSTFKDAEIFLKMVTDCFLETTNTLTSGIIHENNNNDEKSNGREYGILEKVYIYPVKSCAPFEVTSAWDLVPTGLQYDRKWMIVNKNGTCLTQKHNTLMCLIKPIIDLKKNKLVLNFDNRKEETISVHTTVDTTTGASQCKSKVCGDKIQGWDCGDEVARWLDEMLYEDGLRLVEQFDRNVKNDLQLSLANQAQFLLVNKASVKWLYDRVPDIIDGEKKESLNNSIARFRPNFVMDFREAFVENDFRKIYIGNFPFLIQGQCNRCQMICIDQSTGEKTVEPLRTLSRELQGKIFFGIYLQLNPAVLARPAQISPAMKTIAVKNDTSLNF